MQMNQWLKCRVFKGMFHDERAVQYTSKDGKLISVFVPVAHVDGQPDQEGRVLVFAYRDGGTVWAVLPTEHRATIPVHEADLIPA